MHRSAGFTFGFGHERLWGSRFDRDHKLVASTLLRVGAIANSDGATLSLATRWASWQTLSTGPLEVDSVHSESADFALELPLVWTAGVELERNTEDGLRLRLGFEMEEARWSTLSSDLLDPGVAFADATTLSGRVMLTPRGLDDAANGWQHAAYQLGWRQTGYIALDAGLLTSTTYSLGWSLPMLGSVRVSLNPLALQWRHLQAGDIEGELERGFGATVGFTLHPFFKNQWLVPRRYD